MSDQLTMFGEPAPARKPVKASLSKTISCGAEKLFDRWLIPTFAGNWMFGEHMGDDGVGDMSNGVRPGGEFSYTVIRAGKEIICSGSYEVIDRPRCLRFTWLEDGEETGLISVEMQLEPIEEKTKLRVALLVDRNLRDDPSELKQEWDLRCKRLAAQLSR